MYKKMKPAAAAVLATGMLFSGAVDAAPKANSDAGQSEKAKEENKGQVQQFKSIDKQLDKIEEKILKYKAKMDELEEEADLDEPSDDDVTENPSEEVPSEELADDVTEDTSEETPSEVSSADEPVSDEEEAPESPVEEPVLEEELMDEEIEEELNDNPEYTGKFHALQNRLNAASKRLDGLEAKGADVTERRNRIATLQAEVDTVLASITAVQKKVKQEIESDKEAVEKEEVETENEVKEWKIKFSKTLDESTLNELDIIVVDAEQNVVETTLSYDPKTFSVAVTPGQPYTAGKTYMLYIGKDISGADGLNLKNSVKMNFTIAVQ